MILRTIQCSRKACNQELKEVRFNAGFPGWADIRGDFKNDMTGEEGIAHLCPNCKMRVMMWLDGGEL